MPITTVALTNTFDEWRVKTNQIVVALDDDSTGVLRGNSTLTGTITLTNPSKFGSNVTLNVSSGMIKGDGGLLTNLSFKGVTTFENVVNTIYITTNTVFDRTNTIFTLSNTVFDRTNTVYTFANTVFDTTNTVFNLSNTVFTVTNSAFTTTNAAFNHANAAFNQANTALDRAINISIDNKTSAYTLQLSDSGKAVSITTGGVTIPADVFFTSNVVSVFNNSSTTQTITPGVGTVLYLAGTSSTTVRNLAQRGVATILCVAPNTFVISGAGVS